MNIKYFSLLSLVVVILFSQSCKKGCTNPSAYNYQKSANQENGTCLYCDSALNTGGSSYYNLMDYNTSSIYYYQNVLNLVVNSSIITYSGNGCNLLGHNNTSGCYTTYYSAVFQNVTNSNVTFSGNIQIYQYSSSSMVYFQVSNISIAPFSSTTVNLGSGGCQQYSSFSIQQIVNTVFSYH